MGPLQGRVLLVPRPERSEAPVDALVYAADATAADGPLACGSLPAGHRLPNTEPRAAIDIVLAERDDDRQVGSAQGPAVLRSVTGWASADLPVLGTALGGDLVVHPRHAGVPGGRSAEGDQRLRNAFQSRRGGEASGPAVEVELWWAVGHRAVPQAWVSVERSGQAVGWPVLDVPPHLLGGVLPATLDTTPVVGEYVTTGLRSADGSLTLRPAGRARLLLV